MSSQESVLFPYHKVYPPVAYFTVSFHWVLFVMFVIYAYNTLLPFTSAFAVDSIIATAQTGAQYAPSPGSSADRNLASGVSSASIRFSGITLKTRQNTDNDE